jgi:hypothetical protein
MTDYPDSPREAARRFTPELTELINNPLYSDAWTDERLTRASATRDRQWPDSRRDLGLDHPLCVLWRLSGGYLGVDDRRRHPVVTTALLHSG